MEKFERKDDDRTYGQRIRFQIEFMHTMLASGREIEALKAINKALELTDQVHTFELENSK